MVEGGRQRWGDRVRFRFSVLMSNLQRKNGDVRRALQPKGKKVFRGHLLNRSNSKIQSVIIHVKRQ